LPACGRRRYDERIRPIDARAHSTMNQLAYVHLAATLVAPGAFAWSMRGLHGLGGGIATPRPLH